MPIFSAVTQEASSTPSKSLSIFDTITASLWKGSSIFFCYWVFCIRYSLQKGVPDPHWNWEPAALKAILVLLHSWIKIVHLNALTFLSGLVLFSPHQSPRQRFNTLSPFLQAH